MSDPIVHKQPAVQSNPFAKHAPDHVSAGAVAIESERAIAEAQGKLVIAKRFPRNQAVAYANIIDACRRPGLAEEAVYSFPRGGQTVSGPSIRLAEMLAANWGNLDYGIRELSRKEGVSEMEAYCWDLETNVMSSQKFTVRHIRDTKGGGVALKEERDIYELTANMGGRRLRARILAILPADLIQSAVDECGKTLAGGNDLPIGDRIRNMVTAFKTFGVQPALIEKRLGHALDTTTGEELADLRKIHNSIRDGVSKVGDWFGDGPKPGDDEDMPGDPRPEPPAPKKRRGTSAPEVVVPAAETVAPEVPKAEAAPVAPEPPKQVEPVAPEPVKEPAPAPDGEGHVKQLSRTSLNDGETRVAVVIVESVEGLGIKRDNQVHASIKATTKGEFLGLIYQVGGGVQLTPSEVNEKGEITKAATYGLVPPWAVGAQLRVTLLGKHNPHPKVGKVQVFVQSVEPVAPAADEGDVF
jgi:hypothetical protein